MTCPDKWADADHDSFRYNWWVLSQRMLDPLAPRYWWVTGAVVLLIVLPVLQLMVWVVERRRSA